ncbi:esterase-like activity of phytase family protein [Roseibacterium sp. SDUM158016]|uniref:esterase-like activity of phytase family protein n=1 Tax=Roseicyclus sediminis TaxID=2980997 RepID=UPI0021CF9E39|nr:esterase-like activity of phytase family protein [Roseibacterium sp. SDUM158016]MCU4651680.1 esterase-like activity of phytase family protein [Roseibacterium sp. SDUM158016]
MKIRIASLGLAAALAALVPSEIRASGLQLLTDLALTIPGTDAFGGLSAIEMDRDGRGAVIVSDRATMFLVSLDREGGRVTGMGLRAMSPLTDMTGRRPARPDLMDSEGIARLPDGRLALSFEGRMRIAIHGTDGRARTEIAPPPGSGRLPGNGGYEGLAADARGDLWTLAEETPGGGPTPLYRHSGGAWNHVASLPRTGGYKPVGIDFDDRGRLYVLERRFTLGGFSSRITRYPVTRAGVGEGELLLQTPTGRHGNLEGISLWRAGGVLIASAVADNNFRQPNATRLVEYIVPD